MANSLIRLVDGVECPCPSTFSYGLMDISASDAGRVEDANNTMYKNRTSQKRKMELSWNAKKPEDVSKILQMFDPEYIMVTYWDAKDGREEVREFYTGDKTAPVKQWTVNNKLFTSVSLNIIER